MKMAKKHLSPIANSLLERCAEILDTSGDALVEEFESGLDPEPENYSRKLVEFCSSKALCNLCSQILELITDGSFSRFTYDMMLAWECPSSSTEECYSETVAKEKEDKKDSLVGKDDQILDDIPLFYSDAMPLLVNEERSVGLDAFVWLASQLPLVADYVNAEFTFDSLTAPTAYRLYYPAYDRFLKEVDKCIKHLQKQSPPKGVEFADDEVILHVEGTPKTQRVIRHIKTTTWPGKLTLTNRALYFEASGVISYEDALKIDLSASPFDVEVKPASTGPFGAPLYDKAIVCKTHQLSEWVVLEFPELTSSTRRDHWLTLIKEIVLLHQFLSKYKIESPVQSWEMQARTILCIIRLHSAREMLRISPPVPQNFLIFSLFEELPKGDYVLEELSYSLKKITGIHPLCATSMVKNLNISHPPIPCLEDKEGFEVQSSPQPDNLGSLDTTISQVREETKEVRKAKATVEEMKEEGVTDSLLVLIKLLSPLKDVWTFIQEILSWERRVLTSIVLVATLVVIYKEWVGYALAAILLCGVGMMLWARMERIGDRYSEIVVSTSSDQTTIESIVQAQHSLRRLRDMVQTVNITILKIHSIVTSRAPKHANHVMLAMTVAAIFVMVIPFKYVLMALTLNCFISNLMASKAKTNGQVINRRLREWWDSIPVVLVRVVS